MKIKKSINLSKLIDTYYGKSKLLDSWIYGDYAVRFIIFESYLVMGKINEDSFSACVDLGMGEPVKEYNGEQFESSTEESDIKECLFRIETYCSSLLPDKFLIAKGWKKSKIKIPLREKSWEKWKKEHWRYVESRKNNYVESNNKIGSVREWAERFIKAMEDYFGNRVGKIEITEIEEYGQDEGMAVRDNGFSLRFRMYDYYDMIGSGGFGLGWSILKGKYLIPLPTSQEWFDIADFETFFKDMEEEIELRIPEEYLKAKGWLKDSNAPDWEF